VAGGDLDEGEARARRLPMAAARYAALFADHVAQDVGAEGGPSAYVRIWLCARRAFIESMSKPAAQLHGAPLSFSPFAGRR
jgi:hypothetical protein